MGENLVLHVGSTFACGALAGPLRLALDEVGISADLRTSAPEDLSPHMLAPAADSEDIAGALILVRVEDWLREAAQVTDDKAARQELKTHLDEFLGEVAVLAMRGRPVWLMVCPSAGWVAEKGKLTALCRTYTNLLAARLRNLSQITSLIWPEPLSKDEFLDRDQDRANHIPFTSAAFEQLARSLARQLAPILSKDDSNTIGAAKSAGSPELANFLSKLRVQVRLTLAKPSDHADVMRILRTAASFSLAGEKPTLADSEAIAIVASQECWLVSVTDRLSDFGASGVVVARVEDRAFVVESLSLSCTVLGKQVEYALLGGLKEIAAEQNLPTLAFVYRDSGRNQPALAFLKSVANEKSAERYEIPAAEIEARVEKAAVAPGAWNISVDDVAPAH